MSIQLKLIDIEKLRAGSNLMQSPRWAELKARLGHQVIGFRLSAEETEDTLLAIMQHGPRGYRIAYLPWSPRLHPESMPEGCFLEQLSVSLRPYMPEDTLCLRFDLPWRSPFDETPPDPHIRNVRMNFGTQLHAIRKAPTDIQPTTTLMLDLTRSEQDLLSAMRPKTRYNIRLPERRGVRVRAAAAEEIPAWYELYTQTMQRRNIPVHPLSFFTKLFRTRRYGSSGTRFELLMAEHNGIPLAGIIIAVTGSHAVYLYGASGDTGRGLMPTYALQWRAIQLSKLYGCLHYDMFGIPPVPDAQHPMHGLYQFKKGFGGTRVQRRGCWDFPFAAEDYNAMGLHEITRGGYHG
ncbi:MAG: lipid II:glycine glycyltransferase FemX [Spirochaeta sp.]